MVTQSPLQPTKQEAFLHSIQQSIQQKIRLFDAPSLFKLLYSLGYTAKDIYFQSNPSLASAPSLFESISFPEEGYPKVVIIINLGLLTANSPLPSYFRKKMDTGTVDPVLLTRFLGFFDHHLIMTTLGMNLPKENGWFFSNWNETANQYLSLLALNSTSTLWFLFQLCFPELKVEVHKFARVLRVLSSSIILGSTFLGQDSFLGKSQKLTVSSFRITFTCEEMDNDLSTPWPVEIKHRFKELLFPLIHRINTYMQIILVVKNCKDIARLSPSPQLGYRSLGETKGSLRLLLFSGYPKEMLKF